MKFFRCSFSNQNSRAAPVNSMYTVYLSVVTCAPPPQIFIRGGRHALQYGYLVLLYTSEDLRHEK